MDNHIQFMASFIKYPKQCKYCGEDYDHRGIYWGHYPVIYRPGEGYCSGRCTIKYVFEQVNNENKGINKCI